MKLSLINESLKYAMHMDGRFRFYFPDNSIYDYITYDNAMNNNLDKKYRRRPGKLLSILKTICQKPPYKYEKIK